MSKIGIGERFPEWCVLDISKARAQLDWNPKIDLITGILKMAAGISTEYDNGIFSEVLKESGDLSAILLKSAFEDL